MAYDDISVVLKRPTAERSRAPFQIGDRTADYRRLFAFYLDLVENTDFALRKDPESHDRMGRDGTIFSAMRIRQLAVASRSLVIQAVDEKDGEARKYAQLVKTMLEKTERFSQVLLNMLDALGRGMSVQEIEWELGDNLYFYPKKIFPVHISRFAFDTRNELVLRSPIDLFYGERLPPFTYIHHVFDPEPGDWNRPEEEGRIVFGHGLYDRLYPWWLWKSICLRFGLRSSERSASASLVWRYPHGNDDALNKVMAAAKLFDQWSQVFLPQGNGYDVTPMQSQYATTDVFLKFINYIDSQMAKKILGSSMLMDTAGTGAYASLEVHERTTFGRIVSFDEKALLSTLDGQLVSHIFAVNQWDQRKRPQIKFQSGPRWSLTEVVNAILKLNELGFPVSFDTITEETGLRQPAPGESVITFNPTSASINITNGPDGPLTDVTVDVPGEIPKILKHRMDSPNGNGLHPPKRRDSACRPAPSNARLERTESVALLPEIEGEPLMFAAASWVDEVNRAMRNTQLILLTYLEEDEDGGAAKVVKRICEPYSFRKKGQHGLFYARDVEDTKPIKSFKVENIQNVEVLEKYTFDPRYTVEPTD